MNNRLILILMILASIALTSCQQEAVSQCVADSDCKLNYDICCGYQSYPNQRPGPENPSYTKCVNLITDLGYSQGQASEIITERAYGDSTRGCPVN